MPSSEASCLRPKTHQDSTLRIELDDNVRAFVRNPDIVLRINLDRMRVRPGIEVVSDLTQKRPVGPELQQLCGTRSVSGTGRISARKHKDVTFGIHRHARNFPEIHVRWKPQKVGDRAVVDLRHGRRLRAKRTDRKKQQDQTGPLHSENSERLRQYDTPLSMVSLLRRFR